MTVVPASEVADDGRATGGGVSRQDCILHTGHESLKPSL